MQSVRIPDLIQKKRDHKELASHEIDFFVNEMVQGRLEDSQLGTNSTNNINSTPWKAVNQRVDDWLFYVSCFMSYAVTWSFMKWIGAMLMAWYFNGMSPKELAILVDSMTHSGLFS